MPGQMRITFKGFEDGLTFQEFQRIKLPGTSSGPVQDTVLRGGINALGGVSNWGRMMQAALGMIAPPSGTVTVAGAIPGATIRKPTPDYTHTFGPVLGGGAAFGFSVSGGLYLWNRRPKGEIGVYGSVAVGVLISPGAVSGGLQWAMLFGPAATVLKGDCITITVDINCGPGGVSGFVVVSAPTVTWGTPPAISSAAWKAWKPEIIGFGFAATAGPSAWPVDVSIEPGHTWTRALN